MMTRPPQSITVAPAGGGLLAASMAVILVPSTITWTLSRNEEDLPSNRRASTKDHLAGRPRRL